MIDKINGSDELSGKEKVIYGLLLGTIVILTSVFTLINMRYAFIFDIPAYPFILVIYLVLFYFVQFVFSKRYIIKSSTIFVSIFFVLFMITSFLFSKEWCMVGLRTSEWNCKVLFSYESFLVNFVRGYTGMNISSISLFSFILLFKKENVLIDNRMNYKKVLFIAILFFITFIPYIYQLFTGKYFSVYGVLSYILE